jgi:pyruvate/2-oxoglutarate dehydrogenase complex dihydrolipoamide dehydrogenase (E3) component
MKLYPDDEFNAQLVRNVHPPDWRNPEPRSPYNLVVVGGGTAGLVTAVGAAGLGARVALVERHLLGGDCLNYGCVPSKALIRSSRAAHEVRTSQRFGISLNAEPMNYFAAVMERMRRLRAEMSGHDSAERLKGLGVDVFIGDAQFSEPTTVEVAGRKLRFRRAVIATGARADVPETPGLAEAGYLTNETVFSLTELPARLIVVGAGPIGCELAQAFARLGSEVHLVNRSDRLLPKDEPAAGELLRSRFEKEGIHLHLGWKVDSVEKSGGARIVILERSVERRKLIADGLLLGVGRRANVENLGLENAGVAYSERGVTVDDFLQTTNRKTFAAGDVVGGYQFTHAADAMARICIQNALFFGRKRLSALTIPWCTYTDPEVAHIGLTAAQAADRGLEIDSYQIDLAKVDRAVLDDETDGFALVHTNKGTGRLVGGTIVAAHAGEMIGELALLMGMGASLGRLSSVIHCYPTTVEVLKKLGDEFQRRRLTPKVAELMRQWHAWMRGRG